MVGDSEVGCFGFGMREEMEDEGGIRWNGVECLVVLWGWGCCFCICECMFWFGLIGLSWNWFYGCCSVGVELSCIEFLEEVLIGLCKCSGRVVCCV